MCTSISLKYDCRCHVYVRLSTCRGTFGKSDQEGQRSERRQKKDEPSCNSKPYLKYRMHKLCGSCSIKFLVEQREREKDALSKEEDALQVQVHFMQEAAFTSETGRALTRRLRKVQKRINGFEDNTWAWTRDLEQRFPTQFEPKEIRKPPRLAPLDGGSPLRNELEPQDIPDTPFHSPSPAPLEVGNEEEMPDIRPHPVWVQMRELVRAHDEMHGIMPADPAESLPPPVMRGSEAERQEGSLATEAWYDGSSDSAFEPQEGDDWYREQEAHSAYLSPVEEVTEESEAGSVSSPEDTEELIGSDDTPKQPQTHTDMAGDVPDSQGSAEIQGTQLIAVKSRPETPSDQQIPTPDQLSFTSPVKHLAESLYIPSGIIKPLELLGKFSFEHLPMKSILSARTASHRIVTTSEDKQKETQQQGGALTPSSSTPSLHEAKLATPTRAQLIQLPTQAPTNSQGEPDKRNENGTNKPLNKIKQSLQDDTVIRRDSGCGIQDNAST